MTEADDTFRQSASVKLYEAMMDDLDQRERDRRIAILRDFSEFVGRTPDEMAAEIYDRTTHKYRKRGFYTARVTEFQDQVDGPPNVRLARGNVIRSFFIANGSRLVPERPAWM